MSITVPALGHVLPPIYPNIDKLPSEEQEAAGHTVVLLTLLATLEQRMKASVALFECGQHENTNLSSEPARSTMSHDQFSQIIHTINGWQHMAARDLSLIHI